MGEAGGATGDEVDTEVRPLWLWGVEGGKGDCTASSRETEGERVVRCAGSEGGGGGRGAE